MTQVDELLGIEGGLWRVRTEDNSYIIDLDTMIVTRFPALDSTPIVDDTLRPLLRIIRCQVARKGRWTLNDEGAEKPIVVSTTVIFRIEKVFGDRAWRG